MAFFTWLVSAIVGDSVRMRWKLCLLHALVAFGRVLGVQASRTASVIEGAKIVPEAELLLLSWRVTDNTYLAL